MEHKKKAVIPGPVLPPRNYTIFFQAAMGWRLQRFLAIFQIKTIFLKRNPWPFTTNGQSFHLHFEYNRIYIYITVIFWMLWGTCSNHYKYITYYWILTKTQSKLTHEPLHNTRDSNKVKFRLLNLKSKPSFSLLSNICKTERWCCQKCKTWKIQKLILNKSWHILKFFVLKKWRKEIWRVCFIMMMWVGNIFFSHCKWGNRIFFTSCDALFTK